MGPDSQPAPLNTSVGDTRGPWDHGTKGNPVDNSILTTRSPGHLNNPNHPLADVSGVIIKSKEENQRRKK